MPGQTTRYLITFGFVEFLAVLNAG